jgi:predicted permease
VHRFLLPDVAFSGLDVGGRLLAFTLLLTLAAGLVTGILPTAMSVRGNIADGLRRGDGASTRPGSKTRTALLVGQAALSVVLLVGAGLFVRSLRAAEQLDLGFDARRVAVVQPEWKREVSASERQEALDRALEGVRRLPGVHSTAPASFIPLLSGARIRPLAIPGSDSLPPYPGGGPWVFRVGAEFFEAMGLAILRGRGFERSDDAEGARPVTVLSQSMARAIWPNAEAVGSCLLVGSSEEGVQCTEVVGVVEDHHLRYLVEDGPHLMYYLNHTHPARDAYSFLGDPSTRFVVGTTGDPRDVLDLIRAETASASPGVGFINVQVLSDRLERQFRSWMLGAALLTGLGLLALVVAGWGLYSVLAFDMALRHRELGVRSALGASTGSLVGLVLRRALVLTAGGVVAGLAASLAAAGLVEPLLFRISAADPATYAIVTITLLFVSVVTGVVPAFRATRVDPNKALQVE